MALNPSEMHYANTRAAADIVLPNNREIHNLQNEVLMAVRNKFGYWYPDDTPQDVFDNFANYRAEGN